MKKITVLIPCHNEEGNIQELHRALERFAVTDYEIDVEREPGPRRIPMRMADYRWEFLFVNDGSDDGSLEAMKHCRHSDPRVSVLNLSRNFGKENALLAGLDHSHGDAVVMIDADFQHPLEVIPEMIWWWEQGYDDVYAQRLSRGREPLVRKLLTRTFYGFLQRIADRDILPDAGDFRLLDRKAVEAFVAMRETQRYNKGLFCWIGFNKKGVPFHQHERAEGKSSFRYRDLVNLALEGITSYTTTPLRILAVVGFIISILSFVYLIFIFVKTLIWGDPVDGFPTLMCVILFLGGLQLLALGIIGEYIGRIFNESKRRPSYIVESYVSEKEENRGEQE